MNKQDAEKFEADRKAEGLKVDAATAEVAYFCVNYFNPYGVFDACDMDPECADYELSYQPFARSPGSEFWVVVQDLPEATQQALQAKCAKAKEEA
ncbi:MAG: hypothetical protein WBX05_00975 [Pseudolabrys sp.]